MKFCLVILLAFFFGCNKPKEKVEAPLYDITGTYQIPGRDNTKSQRLFTQDSCYKRLDFENGDLTYAVYGHWRNVPTKKYLCVEITCDSQKEYDNVFQKLKTTPRTNKFNIYYQTYPIDTAINFYTDAKDDDERVWERWRKIF